MPTISIRIPQMGEGLQEALLVSFLKKPGDLVRRDEAIYVMETDKASTEVESPCAGRLLEWVAAEGQVLPIGTEIGRLEVDAPVGSTDAGPAHAPAPAAAATGAATGADAGLSIPPRTRKLLKENGLLEIAERIPRRGSKLMPEDVERYLAAQGRPAEGAGPEAGGEYDETPVSKQQVTLNYRLHRSQQTTVPATVMNEVDWTALSQARQQVKETAGRETGFAMMLWCVVQSLTRHPRFRTSLVGDGAVFRTHRHVNLGVAVALPEDTLVTASIHAADSMPRADFFRHLAERIDLARRGVDQADPSITISVSNIGTASMRMGIPAIVAPAVATLALGEVFDAAVPGGTGVEFRKRALLTLAFDHRVINGVGAAAFMNDLKDEIQNYRL